MTTQLFRARLLAAALGAFLCVAAALSQPAAIGPWVKMPVLPTACYQDAFHDKLYAASNAVQADLYKQEAINKQIADAYQNIDPMEMANRMQQWMMANPQEAMKYMQAAQSAGAEFPQLLQTDTAKKQALDAERDALFKRYDAALAAADAPADARWKALMGVPENSRTIAEHTEIRLQRDQLYQAFCPQWWGAAGPIHAFVKKYRTWVTQEHIPYLDKNDALHAQTYAIMNTPAASYKSTSTLVSVHDYMTYTGNVFGRRPTGPNCPNGKCPPAL